MKLAVLPTLALLTACGTLVNGPSQSVALTSEPTHADVYVDSQYRGKTPVSVRLSRKENHEVRMELPGYAPYETVLDTRLSKWAFGNLAFGGVLGLAVDALSGGLYRLSAEQVHAQIEQGTLAHLEMDNGAQVIVVEGADPAWEPIGQLQQ